jgi:hypothetical protein
MSRTAGSGAATTQALAAGRHDDAVRVAAHPRHGRPEHDAVAAQLAGERARERVVAVAHAEGLDAVIWLVRADPRRPGRQQRRELAGLAGVLVADRGVLDEPARGPTELQIVEQVGDGAAVQAGAAARRIVGVDVLGELLEAVQAGLYVVGHEALGRLPAPVEVDDAVEVAHAPDVLELDPRRRARPRISRCSLSMNSPPASAC